MAYYVIDDFRAGFDVRKSVITAPAGTLRQLQNAHVNPGGEIEKRLAFVESADFPNTVGLIGQGNQAFVLSHLASAQVQNTGDLTIAVKQIVPNDGSQIAALIDWDLFDGNFFLVIRTTNGNIEHFYNDTFVSGGKGVYCKTYRQKVYTIGDKFLNFCATGNPADWAGTGSGFINLNTEDGESGNLLGLEVYYDQLAILSEHTTQFYSVDPDPALNQLLQTLRRAGTYAPLSVRQYGNGDVLYLDDTGMRSLYARNSSNAAAVSDIGSPIDPYIESLRRQFGHNSVVAAQGHIEPRTGRFWLILGDRILVLSNFPGPKVTAWGEYIPGFDIDYGAVVGPHILVRTAAGKIYVYGGIEYNTWDSAEVLVQTPLLSLGAPATQKDYQGLDVACQGTWEIAVAMDRAAAVWENVGTVIDSTYPDLRLPMSGQSSHISLRARHQAAGPAVLSNAAIHYFDAQSD